MMMMMMTMMVMMTLVMMKQLGGELPGPERSRPIAAGEPWPAAGWALAAWVCAATDEA